MRKFILLSILLLIAGSITIFAQRRGSSRGNQARPGSTRNVNSSDRARRSNQNRSFDNQRVSNQRGISNSPNDTRRRRPTKIKKLLSGLHLTAEQKAQTKEILKNAKENGTSKKQTLREINSILTPRQSNKFVHKIKRIYNNKNTPKPKKLGKLLRGLELTPQQQAQTKRILKNARKNDVEKNQVLRQINSILTPEQSRKFKHKIKRIYQNKNEGDGSSSGDSDNSGDSNTRSGG